MSKMKKILLGVLILLVAVSAFQAWWNAPDRELQREGARPTPTPGVITRESIVEQCRDATERNFPGHNLVEYNADEKQLTIAIWIDDMDEAAVAAMIGATGTRDSWSELVADLENASGSWQDAFDRSGFSDVTVVVHLLNPSNLDNALASAAHGQLIYDVVDGYVSSRTAVSQPASQTFVINKDSKVFHLLTCGAVDHIKPENFDYYVGTRDGAIANGYSPCSLCNP